MKPLIFALVVASDLFLTALLLRSIRVPERRVWPPPGRRSWQYRAIWGPTWVATLGTLVLGVLDWDRSVLGDSLRFSLGAILLGVGLAFAGWGFWTLGVHATGGLGGEFVTSGPYRWSRNPQYAGDITALIGYAILCNSLLVLMAAILGVSVFALTPFAEEPWLRERFGDRYDEYRRRVPRFLGPRRAPLPAGRSDAGRITRERRPDQPGTTTPLHDQGGHRP